MPRAGLTGATRRRPRLGGSPTRRAMPRPRRRPPSGAGRYLAPAAFLLAVTIAVLLIRSGLQSDNGSPTTTSRGPVTHASTTPAPPPGTTRKATTTLAEQTYTVESGDTF